MPSVPPPGTLTSMHSLPRAHMLLELLRGRSGFIGLTDTDAVSGDVD